MKIDFNFEQNVGRRVRVQIKRIMVDKSGNWVEGTLITDMNGYYLLHHNPDFQGAIPKDYHLKPGEYSWCIFWSEEVNCSIQRIELIEEKPSPWKREFNLEDNNEKEVSVLVDTSMGFTQWVDGTLHKVNLMSEGGTDTYYYLCHNDPKFAGKYFFEHSNPYSMLLYSEGKYATNILNIYPIKKPRIERTLMPIRLVFERGENIPGSMLGRDIDKVIKSKILGEEMFVVYYGTDGK